MLLVLEKLVRIFTVAPMKDFFPPLKCQKQVPEVTALIWLLFPYQRLKAREHFVYFHERKSWKPFTAGKMELGVTFMIALHGNRGCTWLLIVFVPNNR